ncbi:unnamed protein product [Closterium sp. NIES-54]
MHGQQQSTGIPQHDTGWASMQCMYYRALAFDPWTGVIAAVVPHTHPPAELQPGNEHVESPSPFANLDNPMIIGRIPLWAAATWGTEEGLRGVNQVTNTRNDIPRGIFARVWDMDAADEAALLPQVHPPSPSSMLSLCSPTFLLPPSLLQAHPPFTEVLHFDSQQPCIVPSSATAVVLRADGAIALWTASQCTHHTASNQVAPRRARSRALPFHPPQKPQQYLVYLPRPPLSYPPPATAVGGDNGLGTGGGCASSGGGENGDGDGSSDGDGEGCSGVAHKGTDFSLGPTTERFPTSRVALPCLSRRPAGCRVALPCPSCRPACCRVALPCQSRRPAGRRIALLPARCFATCASPCPARNEPPCCPHRPAARRPAAARPTAHSPAGRRPAARAPPCWQPHRCLHRPACDALLCAALLAGALLPAQPCCAPPCFCPPCCAEPCWQQHHCSHRPAATRPVVRRPAARRPVGSRTALPCPRAALLATALPCPGRALLFPSRAPLLPALHAYLVLARRPACFDTWLDDLQLYLLSNSRDIVSLFDHTSGASLAPPTTADSATRSQWLTRDAAACLAIRNHLPLAERAHFGQHKTAKALYNVVVTRYSSPTTPALGRPILPYLFPELSAFATWLPTFVLATLATALPSQPIRDHFLALDPTDLTVDLLEKHLLAPETIVVAVGASRGTPRTSLFEGCPPSPLALSYASAAVVDILGTEDVGTSSALSGKRRSSKGKGGKSGGGGSMGGGGGGIGGGGGGGGGGSGGSGGGGGGFGGGGGGSGGGGGGSGGGSESGGGSSGGGRGGVVQRGGSGGGQRQQQQRRSETPTPQQLREWFAQRGASGVCSPWYVVDLVFATADTEALALVKSELQKRPTCTDLGELRSYLGLQITRDRARCTITLTQSHMVHQVLQRFGFRYSSPQSTSLPTDHSLLAPPSDESVEPSGLYPELVGWERVTAWAAGAASEPQASSARAAGAARGAAGAACGAAGRLRDFLDHVEPREWHDKLRMTLAALGFAPSTADPSLILRTDTLLPPFYVLVYIDDLVFATADTEALAIVKSKLQKKHTCTDLGELRSYLGLHITRDRARHTITLTQSHMVHQVLQRFGFRYSSPLSTPLPTGQSLSAPPSDESVEPSGPYPKLKAAKRVLRYLCSTSGMGLVLGGRGPVVLTGHADASLVDDLATQRSSQGYTFSLGSGSVSWRSTRSSSVLSSSCETEIYARAMAAQELRWLTYLLTDLGERPRSSPVMYVDNKAMIALSQEHGLEHRTKHIALCYFLAQELQQCGQLCLAYVANRANTANIFTKALQSGDHQRFYTVLGLVPTLPHLLTS